MFPPSTEDKCSIKALEIFAQFAENVSYADAFCPNLSSAESNSPQFAWWGASLKPGLTDKHVTVKETSDWLAGDTRASIRGALEVANLESCRMKVKSLSEDMTEIGYSSRSENTEDQNSALVESKLCNFEMLTEHLPPLDCNSVLRLNEASQPQKR